MKEEKLVLIKTWSPRTSLDAEHFVANWRSHIFGLWLIPY